MIKIAFLIFGAIAANASETKLTFENFQGFVRSEIAQASKSILVDVEENWLGEAEVIYPQIYKCESTRQVPLEIRAYVYPLADRLVSKALREVLVSGESWPKFQNAPRLMNFAFAIAGRTEDALAQELTRQAIKQQKSLSKHQLLTETGRLDQKFWVSTALACDLLQSRKQISFVAEIEFSNLLADRVPVMDLQTLTSLHGQWRSMGATEDSSSLIERALELQEIVKTRGLTLFQETEALLIVLLNGLVGANNQVKAGSDVDLLKVQKQLVIKRNKTTGQKLVVNLKEEL